MKSNKGLVRLSGVVFLAIGLVMMATACPGPSPSPTGGGQASPAQSAPAESPAAQKACDIVTQQDATALFGQTASPQEGQLVVDPNLIGECLWTWDTATSNQLLQFRIWNGPQYYGAPSDSQPLDIGEKGYIRVHPLAGVDIEWVQNGKTISLSYSTIGSDIPNATTKVEELKTLARKVEKQL